MVLFDKIITEINPESTLVLNVKGKILESQNKPEEAEEYFKKAQEMEAKKSAIISEK